MRILQVASADVIGGGEVHVIQLVGKLRERGHTVEIAGRGNGPLDPNHPLGFRNAMDIATSLKLRRIVREQQYDIVHAHIARDYPITAMALARLPGPRLVLTRQLIFRVAGHPAYRRVDGWIVTTEQIRQSIQHLRPRAETIVPNWVDTSRIRYEPRPVGRPVTIGLLGQISPHKGHDDALDMIGQLGDGYRLMLGGRGKPDYEQALKDRAGNLPVTFPGWVEAAAFMREIDIFILPSWEEPFGIVVLEAMAAGVPVIATHAGGPPGILDHGNAGLLVPPRNAAALAGAVRTLTGDEPLRDRLRTAARTRAESHYDIEGRISETEAFYERLVRGKV